MPHTPPPRTPFPPRPLSRRRLLVALGLGPVALAGCGLVGGGDDGPDPLIALAAAARADAALGAAVVAAQPALAERVDPLVAARTEHAAALDAEVRRLAPDAGPPAQAAADAAPAPAGAPTLAALRTALDAAAAAAADTALGLPVERVGLVAAVSACCATYAAVLV